MLKHVVTVLMIILITGISEGSELIDLSLCAGEVSDLTSAANEYENQRNMYESAKSEYESACNPYYGYYRNNDSACGMYGYITQNRNSTRSYAESALSYVESALVSVRKACDVDRGITRPLVKATKKHIIIVQQALKNAGYSPGDIDGVMGKKTRLALTKLQHDHGLPTTGRLDGDTFQILLMLHKNAISR
jgi:hypothetical protein